VTEPWGRIELDGVWRVRRESGLLPPMLGVRKIVTGDRGWTMLGPIRAGFQVVGNELRYCGALRGFVDVLEQDGKEWKGRALYRGRGYGRFRLSRSRPDAGPQRSAISRTTRGQGTDAC
jgi:hypothetical protein